MLNVRSSRKEYSLVLEFAANGDVTSLRKVEDWGLLFNARCSSGCTAVHWASGGNHVEVLRFLIQERGFSVDIRATRKALDRTPLHYACRNGCLDAAIVLEQLGANVDARAKHNVSPFQLAVWQNHLPICKWLVHNHNVDPTQVNQFNCGAVHWIGICPWNRRQNILDMAKWLDSLDGIDFTLKQRQGHSPLHKAAWGGHLDLISYLRDVHAMLDDSQDEAGNYAADLADMANTERHKKVAEYLRRECSAARAQSCQILGVEIDASSEEIRAAYLDKARTLHPDRLPQQSNDNVSQDFDSVQKAYKHLTSQDGVGNQCNPAHSLNLMLELNGSSTNKATGNDNDCFKARLVAVLLEYGDKGLDLSNVRKKWKQVWPGTPFPADDDQSRRKGGLASFIRKHAGDVVEIVLADNGTSQIVVPRNCTRRQVAQAAASKKSRG